MPLTDIVVLDDVKAQLQMSGGPLSGSDSDEELQAFIDAASDVVEQIVGPVRQQTVTDTFRAVGSRRLLLLSTVPVQSVTSATVSVYGQSSVTYATDALTVDPVTGELLVTDGSFWTSDVTVVYTAGRDTVPPAVRLATLVLVAHLWETQRGAASFERPSFAGGEAEQVAPFSSFSVPNRVTELLAGYAQPPAVT